MSIWPLIEAGEFSAISNGQVTAEDLALADGKWTNFVERKVAELPPGFRTAARYALVTSDTALFQGLARSVQYGDFVAKAILYDDLVKRKKQKPRRLSRPSVKRSSTTIASPAVIVSTWRALGFCGSGTTRSAS